MTPGLDILCPVLNRPTSAAPFVHSLRDATITPWRLLFLCSPGDIAQRMECAELGKEDNRVKMHVVSWEAGRGDYGAKMSLGFSLTTAPWVLLAADDLRFEEGWDVNAFALDDGEVGVIGTNDQTNPHFSDGRNSTHPLLRRDYINEHGGSVDEFGVVIHPGYDHNFTERELNGTAQHRGKYVYAPNARLQHNHHLFKTAPVDKTYRKGAKNFGKDQRLFFSRAHLWDYHGLFDNEKLVARKMAPA